MLLNMYCCGVKGKVMYSVCNKMIELCLIYSSAFRKQTVELNAKQNFKLETETQAWISIFAAELI